MDCITNDAYWEQICDTDEDDEDIRGIYEGGHWTWDEKVQGLNFISDKPESEITIVKLPTKAPTGTIQFRDNIDLMEQMRFRRRYQRKIKVGQLDVITVQDIKDIALFTAPVTLLSPKLINLLHIPTTERFIRALILFCQYYLQIAEEMANRMKEQETKIRTPMCDEVEKEYRDNLADIRLLVAKEYCTMIMGGADTRRYHHMGSSKRKHSLSDRDARLFEMLLRMCVQIVWLALGRKSFHQIELEVNRIFKSEIFNATEHNLRTGYISKMSKSERSVLLGCVKQGSKLNTCSPLMNEVMCKRYVDYRLLALGVVKYPELSPRLKYMLLAISSPEEELMNLGICVGVLGMHRSLFDIMLHPLPPVYAKNKLKCSVPSGATASTKSASSMSQKSQNRIVYPSIVLPPRERKESYFPPGFPIHPETPHYCSEEQLGRWQRRLIKLLRPRRSSCHQRASTHAEIIPKK